MWKDATQIKLQPPVQTNVDKYKKDGDISDTN